MTSLTLYIYAHYNAHAALGCERLSDRQYIFFDKRKKGGHETKNILTICETYRQAHEDALKANQNDLYYKDLCEGGDLNSVVEYITSAVEYFTNAMMKC